MSTNNFEEDNDTLLTDLNNPVHFSSLHDIHSSKDFKFRQDTKENDTTLSLFGTGRVDFTDVSSPKTFLNRKKQGGIATQDIQKREFNKTIKETK